MLSLDDVSAQFAESISTRVAGRHLRKIRKDTNDRKLNSTGVSVGRYEKIRSVGSGISRVPNRRYVRSSVTKVTLTGYRSLPNKRR